MRTFGLLLLLACALLGGCRGYSLDMSGLNDYSSDETGDSGDRFSMSALDASTEEGLERSSRGLTVGDADSTMSRELEATNDRLSMSRLNRMSGKHVEPAGEGMGIGDLERVTSRKLDPDNNKIK